MKSLSIAACVATLYTGAATAQSVTPASTLPKAETDWIMLISPKVITAGVANVAPVYFDSESDCQAVASQVSGGSIAKCIQAKIVVLPQARSVK